MDLNAALWPASNNRPRQAGWFVEPARPAEPC